MHATRCSVYLAFHWPSVGCYVWLYACHQYIWLHIGHLLAAIYICLAVRLRPNALLIWLYKGSPLAVISGCIHATYYSVYLAIQGLSVCCYIWLYFCQLLLSMYLYSAIQYFSHLLAAIQVSTHSTGWLSMSSYSIPSVRPPLVDSRG
jgi:hypothetical protein